MSQENVMKFYQAVAQDSILQQQMLTAPDRPSLISTALKLGAEKGYSFTEQEVEDWLTTPLEQSGSVELSDTELEMVAGGKDAGSALASAAFGGFIPFGVGTAINAGRAIANAAGANAGSCGILSSGGSNPKGGGGPGPQKSLI
ncbi:MAG: Nif11-like leader peptide family natural product precursor [Chroococcidiopsidaceae cyanobacterium CP_BM_RX_35]|nr:Nif11-like leader peptide family natural product precursor [Chroococcidiopsidaceae cyanobacterium CP_BM_RX_35]